MRGGALPLIAWGSLLAVLLAINWIWSGKWIQVAEFGFAVLVVYGAATILVLATRQAVRRGPPPAEARVEAVPAASLSAVVVALAIAAILFGLAWASFLVYFGAGVLILAGGRLWLELRAERETRRAAEREPLR